MKYMTIASIPPPLRLLLMLAVAIIVIAGVVAVIFTAFSRPRK
jgi:hypothetical protein